MKIQLLIFLGTSDLKAGGIPGDVYWRRYFIYQVSEEWLILIQYPKAGPTLMTQFWFFLVDF